MVRSIEATYENGVFVPSASPGLPDHTRVRLTVEPIAPTAAQRQQIALRRGQRIRLDPELAEHIALAPELADNEW